MNDQDYILFENYLSKELTKEEEANFELRLKTDSEFIEAFNSYKDLSSFLEHKFENETELKAFQDNLSRISKSHFDKNERAADVKSVGKTFQFYKYAIAACVVVLFGIFTFNQFSNPSYGDYNTYETVSLTVRGENDVLLKTAENAFNSKDFASAEVAFKQLLIQDSNNSELKLYSAISNIELDDFSSAEALLNDLINGNSAFKNTAIWYLGLSKLKQKKIKECISVLMTIPENADEYEQAKELINELE